jgi:hypothetical protein
MPENEAHLDTVHALVAGREDLISRIAAPLWARVGRPLNSQELHWARSLLGDGGPAALVLSLSQFGALDDRTKVLNARGLSRFLSALLNEPTPIAEGGTRPELVWTLPSSHPAHTVRGRTYLESCARLITESKATLALISPFIDPGGIGTLLGPIIGALARGVSVRLFTHDVLNLGTPTSRALEQLRREASRINSDLNVYSAAEAGVGRDRLVNPLFHAKLMVSDERLVLVGSANLTTHALGGNFEAGVLLGEAAATEALYVIEGILRAKAVYLVFRTKEARVFRN